MDHYDNSKILFKKRWKGMFGATESWEIIYSVRVLKMEIVVLRYPFKRFINIITS